MPPSPATLTARRSAAVNAAGMPIAWSAGVTTRIGSLPAGAVRFASIAASVSAGAVLRPSGSSSTRAGSMPTWRSCSMTVKRCSSLATTQGGCTAMPAAPIAAMRWAACWKSVASLLPTPSERYCLG